jgi:hypothetical protein
MPATGPLAAPRHAEAVSVQPTYCALLGAAASKARAAAFTTPQVVVHNRPGGIVQDRINFFKMQFLTPELQEDRPSFQFSGGKLTYTIQGGLAGRQAATAAGVAMCSAVAVAVANRPHVHSSGTRLCPCSIITTTPCCCSQHSGQHNARPRPRILCGAHQAPHGNPGLH